MSGWRRPTVRLGLGYDDVLLVPKKTAMTSRKHVRLGTELVSGINLAVPLLSANTPWCTGAELATAMARLGGFGFVHRMQSARDQIDMITVVKAVAPEQSATIGRDGGLAVGAAVGVHGDYLDRAAGLVAAGVDVLLVDIAHGHSAQTLAALEKLKARHPGIPVVAGNVATAAGTRDLVGAGADAVKVGIGPGGICTTRQVAGAGVPQVTAIMDCAEEAMAAGVPLIADGGVRTTGDMVKALAAGASTVMLGSMLAGVDESAALLVERDGRKHKITTGFVTLGVPLTLKRADGKAITKEELEDYVPEGVEATFPYRGPLAATLKQYTGGIRSGLSYSGAATIPELWQRAEFVQVSAAGQAENRPHAAERAPQVQPDYYARYVAETSG